MSDQGQLYICATPIGNMEDITFRTLKTLKEVDSILCEDTRVTQKILNRYSIKIPLISYHKFSEKQKATGIVELLKEGKNLALVSDAGTPLISDPGCELVKQAEINNIKITPIPGVSAVTAILSAVSREDEDFAFVGFLPRKKTEIEVVLNKYPNTSVVFYEAPSRLVKTLVEINELYPDKILVVGRELTKIHEEIKRDKISNLIEYYCAKPPKGEIVCVLINESSKTENLDDEDLLLKIKTLKKANYSDKEISKILSLLTNWPKNKIYEIVLSLKN